jgi:hypothetical protein
LIASGEYLEFLFEFGGSLCLLGHLLSVCLQFLFQGFQSVLCTVTKQHTDTGYAIRVRFSTNEKAYNVP